ncbi:MAG: hypothetical protein ACP59X_17480 [Solidesulfovibrio sp. DCME]|uniref:hypothetical protein n=1 Tax=Solidesulfovibrio sp. DCME TaxID=3447380 RepID=UPI003D11C7C0
MKRLLVLMTLCLAVLVTAGSAQALTVAGPGFAVSLPVYATVGPPPVYVEPAYVPPPVIYAPPPVYVGPAYVPPPVWVGPRVYGPPVRPVAVGPMVAPRPPLAPMPMGPMPGVGPVPMGPRPR